MKKRFLLFILCALLLWGMAILGNGLAEEGKLYVLDATLDLPAMAQGEKKDGDSETFKDYFTVMYSAKNKIDGSTKAFEDGYSAAQRLNFGGKTQPGKDMINSVRFTTQEKASVKFWWVSGGDGRQFALYDAEGNVQQKTNVDSVKNSLYISSFEIGEAGTYYLGVPEGSNYLFKLEVTERACDAMIPERAAWDQVAGPVILAAQDQGNGEMAVTVKALVGFDGADEVTVSMLDGAGQMLESRRSLAEKEKHTLLFTPAASGEYGFTASAAREGEAEKNSASTVRAAFILPLDRPAITGITSMGGGSLLIQWTEVAEAEGYEIFCDGEAMVVCQGAQHTLSGLTEGTKYAIAVRAIRGGEKGELSAEAFGIPTREAQQAWLFTIYGPSTNTADNGYIGGINEEGYVTVYSENGKGKIQPNADDGVAFYYTAVPADQNFTLQAHVHVDNWDYSNGQEGFGLMAADSVAPMGTSSFFTNQHMALAGKIEYYWQGGKVSDVGTKYSMRLGLGVLSKLGRTSDTPQAILGKTWPLETSAPFRAQEGVVNYNIIGNNTNRDILDKTAATIAEMTDFILEIQKNNTGYQITCYGEDGKIIGQYVDYDPHALEILDSENVYVGFFAARRARVTFSQVKLTITDPSQDAAAREKPVEKVVPTFSITSSPTANQQKYTFSCVANVAGTMELILDGETITDNMTVLADVRSDYVFDLPGTGEMMLEAWFTPDEDQDLGENRELSSAKAFFAETTITYTNAYAKLAQIYVSPKGTPSGLGTREKPLSLAAAVQYVQPGQEIIMLEGVYQFIAPLRIPQGMDGTLEKSIIMRAADSLPSRPVLDFQGLSAGIVHGGDHWHFKGFDVTGAANGQKGFQVSGHYNVLEDICAYGNGNTGIQISRYAGSDPITEWPSYNLVLNCTAYNNVDAGYEDADGFAAKLTCGPGNVFDGCVAYHNADDGFDLYAKLETGPIGEVVIRNSVAYSNGFLLDGTSAGNGNGFKMGGSNMPGGHRLENSYAFFNKSKGIDSNSCPDLQVENCISYNNLRYNVAFYTNLEQNTAYQAQGLISFKDASIPGGDASEADEFKPKGNQDPAAYLNASCYYWDGSAARNADGDGIDAKDFQSLTFQGVGRNADGSIDLRGFLQWVE